MPKVFVLEFLNGFVVWNLGLHGEASVYCLPVPSLEGMVLVFLTVASFNVYTIDCLGNNMDRDIATNEGFFYSYPCLCDGV